MKTLFIKLFGILTHFYGRISRKYYFEDFVRVYPNGLRIDRLGRLRPAKPSDNKNFLNHQKFYTFSAQFTQGLTVADVGCGSGYGSFFLKNSGAKSVYGCDASKNAINFAIKHFGNSVEYRIQSITDMYLYKNEQFDLTICSEVLEHIKEYGMEHRALQEIKRITRRNGIIVIGTPNSELLGEHGFSFEEIEVLMKTNFSQFCIFENALVPFGASKRLWDSRLLEGRTGVIITQAINFEETVLPNGVIPQLKKGIPAGIYRLASQEIDTTLLHNTHSWAIIAIKN